MQTHSIQIYFHKVVKPFLVEQTKDDDDDSNNNENTNSNSNCDTDYRQNSDMFAWLL